MNRHYDYTFKLVMVGSCSVGKTAIMRRFSDNDFQQNYLSTLGIDFRFRSLHMFDNYLKLLLWDTAGQEKFRNITKLYYTGAHLIILVYAINDQNSFQDIVQYWFEQIRNYVKEHQIVCFANKCDKYSQHITEEQENFFYRHRITVYEVSAKTGSNITQAIEEIVKLLIDIYPKIPQQKLSMKLNQINPFKKKKTCCK